MYKMPGFYGDYNLFEGRFTRMMVDFWLDFMQSDRDFETKICYENVFLEATIYEYDEVSEQLSDAYRILGNLYAAQKLYEKAIENYRAALRIRQQIFGSRHQYTRQICGEMADLYAQNGDVDIAKDYKDFSEGIG
jgi:tetratricopeptide (TPR) repeat protein